MKLSFVIPTYNCVTWLPHAVESCLQQTYKDIEIVVVNDCSTDRTNQYLDWLKSNEKVKIIHNEINLGRSKSRNLGNKEAQGEIICVLDSDDISTPNRAEITVKKFKSTTADFIYGAATIINVIGNPLNVTVPDTFDKDKVLANPNLHIGIVHSTVAYTKEFATKFPYQLDEIAEFGIDDWAQQMEGKTKGQRFDFVTQRLCCYRIHDGQITKKRDEVKVMEAKKRFLNKLGVLEPVA